MNDDEEIDRDTPVVLAALAKQVRAAGGRADMDLIEAVAATLRDFVARHPSFFSTAGLARLSAGAIAAGGPVGLSGARGFRHLGTHDDPALWLSVVEFQLRKPTTVHSHATWGAILGLGGVDRYRLFERGPDHADGRVRVELVREWILQRGDLGWWFDPPTNIHEQEALGDGSAFGLVLMGHDPRGTIQHQFDLATGRAISVPYMSR